MKKSRFLAYLIAGACACMTFTACGSDDDDNVPENPSDTNNPTATAGPHTVYATLDGNKVTLAKLGSYSFNYNSENYAVDIAGSKMSYDSGKIIFPDGKTGNFKLNNQGYFDELVVIDSTDDSYEKEESTTTYRFTYDKDGQLTKVDSKTNEISIDKVHGKQYTYEAQDYLNLFWKNGSITSAVSESTEKTNDDGEIKIRTKKTEYMVNYDGKENQLGQYTLSYANWFDLGQFAIVGLMGKAPSQLPMSILLTTTGLDFDGTSINGSGAYDYTYTVDSTGKIQTESVNNTPYIYTYNNISLGK